MEDDIRGNRKPTPVMIGGAVLAGLLLIVAFFLYPAKEEVELEISWREGWEFCDQEIRSKTGEITLIPSQSYPEGTIILVPTEEGWLGDTIMAEHVSENARITLQVKKDTWYSIGFIDGAKYYSAEPEKLKLTVMNVGARKSESTVFTQHFITELSDILCSQKEELFRESKDQTLVLDGSGNMIQASPDLCAKVFWKDLSGNARPQEAAKECVEIMLKSVNMIDESCRCIEVTDYRVDDQKLYDRTADPKETFGYSLALSEDSWIFLPAYTVDYHFIGDDWNQEPPVSGQPQRTGDEFMYYYVLTKSGDTWCMARVFGYLVHIMYS